MSYLFYAASSFNQDLSNWDVSNVGYIYGMFQGAHALSNYNRCVIHTSFSSNDNWPYDWSNYCVFTPFTKEELQTAVDLWVDDSVSALETYGEINNWNVSFITDMSSLFYEKASFNNNINNWDVSNVTNMHRMFRGASSFNQSLNSWDVSSVNDMSTMFQNAESYNQDISRLEVSISRRIK